MAIKTIVTFPDKTREPGEEFETLNEALKYVAKLNKNMFFEGKPIKSAKVDLET
jgi:hypothetical protein